MEDRFDSILDYIYGRGFFTGVDSDDEGLPCVVFEEEERVS
jgi:hypothetical protein